MEKVKPHPVKKIQKRSGEWREHLIMFESECEGFRPIETIYAGVSVVVTEIVVYGRITIEVIRCRRHMKMNERISLLSTSSSFDLRISVYFCSP